MPQKTHYQDDLFFFSVLVKALESGLAIEVDSEYFLERIAGDIFFLDGSIRNFHGLLTQNTHLIDRAEYLKLLERTARSFALCVEGLIAGKYPLSEHFLSYTPQLRNVLDGQRAISAEIGALLAGANEGSSETDLVSEDELSELLKS